MALLELHSKLHFGLFLAVVFYLETKRVGFFPKYWHHKFTPFFLYQKEHFFVLNFTVKLNLCWHTQSQGLQH